MIPSGFLCWERSARLLTVVAMAGCEPAYPRTDTGCSPSELHRLGGSGWIRTTSFTCLMTTPVGPAGCESAPLLAKHAVDFATGPVGGTGIEPVNCRPVFCLPVNGISLFSCMAALVGIEPTMAVTPLGRFRDGCPAIGHRSQVIFSCGVGPAGCEPAPLIERAVNCATDPWGRSRSRTDIAQTISLPARGGVLCLVVVWGRQVLHLHLLLRRRAALLYNPLARPAGIEPAIRFRISPPPRWPGA